MRIQAIKSISVRNRAVRANVFFHQDFHENMVTFMLLYWKNYLGFAIGTFLGRPLSVGDFMRALPDTARDPI
jgi:hypothetical protein